MKKLLSLIGVALVISSCTATHDITSTPRMTRQAVIHNDYVVLVTRTKFTVAEYNQIVAANIVNNRDKK